MRKKVKITAAMIRGQALQLHGFDVTPARGAELALDIERHNTAVRNAARQLDFNDEPGRFNALLAAYAEAGKQQS